MNEILIAMGGGNPNPSFEEKMGILAMSVTACLIAVIVVIRYILRKSRELNQADNWYI